MKQLFNNLLITFMQLSGILIMFFASMIAQQATIKRPYAQPKSIRVPLKTASQLKKGGKTVPPSAMMQKKKVPFSVKKVSFAPLPMDTRQLQSQQIKHLQGKYTKYLQDYLLKRVPTADVLQKMYPIPATILLESYPPQPYNPSWENGGYFGENYKLFIKDKPIFFYDLTDKYGDFTNFYRAPISIDGKVWPTTEHYFQAQKFPTQPKIQEQIRNTVRPREVFDIANSWINRWYVRSDWNKEYVFLPAMYRALVAKFTQHNHLFAKLRATGTKILVEDTARAKREDKRWGAGSDYKGENYLGRLLMYIRDLSKEFDTHARRW